MDARTFTAQAASLHLRLVRAGYALCGDKSLAEECAQDALAGAWARVNSGESFESLEAWTLTVALNRCRSALRRQGAERRAMGRVAALADRRPASGGGDPDRLSDYVHRAVLELPLRQREVVVRHYLLDQDIAAIAADTGISRGAVKNALHHARRSLADALGPSSADPVDDSAQVPSTPFTNLEGTR